MTPLDRCEPFATPRRGFTLVELMVVIAIIGILASALITAMFSATQTARRARTQQLVSKLHAQMLGRWEQYQMRRLPIDAPTVLATQFSATESDSSGSRYALRLAAYKLLALRELMRVEMPERYEDISYKPVYLVNSMSGSGGGSMPYTPDLQRLYTNRLVTQFGGTLNSALNRVAEPFSDAHAPGYVAPNDPAECLYLTTFAGADDRMFIAATFSEADQGDTDGDGMREFVDAWGQPVRWFRWPAGFESDYQPVYRIQKNSPVGRRYGGAQPTDPYDPNLLLTHFPTVNDRLKSTTQAQTNMDTVINNHDPFDPLEVDKWEPMPTNSKGAPSTLLAILKGSWDPRSAVYSIPERGYRLTPLIVSPGPNNIIGLEILPESEDKNMPTDPYAYEKESSGATPQSASPIGNDTESDNVHNHMIGASLR